MNWHTAKQLLTRGAHAPAVLLAVLLAVGPASAVVPQLVSVAVAQNPLSNGEEESGHEDHPTHRFAWPQVSPPPVPAIRPADWGPIRDHRSPSVLPARCSHSAHGRDGPHLRC